MLALVAALTLVLAQNEKSTAQSAEDPLPMPPEAVVETISEKPGHLAPSVDAKPTEQQKKSLVELPWYLRLSIGGFARVQAGYTLPLGDERLVGGNGGFRVADFRLNLDFRPVDKLSVYTSIELAAPLVQPEDPLTGRRIVELRDAFIQYDICPGALVRAGQFRPSYDAEMLMADGAIPFTSRSVVANGFSPPDAYGPRQALAPDRQIGVQIGSKRLGNQTVGFKYAVGLFNGAGPNQLYNDNNGVMPVGRVELDFAQWLTLGLNASYNTLSEGVRPNRLMTRQLNYGADLEAHKSLADTHVLSAMLVYLGRSSTYSYSRLTAEGAHGAMAQARYLHQPTGLEGALRFAYYEPSTAQLADDVSELTAMVGWRPFKLPFRVLAQYTHRSESAAVGYPNDNVDVMLHAVW